MQAEFGIDFPLVLGKAEKVPYDDNTFDLAISEYGASLWCDPYRAKAQCVWRSWSVREENLTAQEVEASPDDYGESRGQSVVR
ncbi:hypothetical protein ACFS5L_18720 [Streptomyces phyllanthi]|uniref:hypothetical protein n=1 Tax=Streptomyces phyllanthi TaxID=1803180 RepID=UPI00223FB64F|nr:hypothetical protein [Streptomyces phyllanthi]